jgi:hypothetical protein
MNWVRTRQKSKFQAVAYVGFVNDEEFHYRLSELRLLKICSTPMKLLYMQL